MNVHLLILRSRLKCGHMEWLESGTQSSGFVCFLDLQPLQSHSKSHWKHVVLEKTRKTICWVVSFEVGAKSCFFLDGPFRQIGHHARDDCGQCGQAHCGGDGPSGGWLGKKKKWCNKHHFVFQLSQKYGVCNMYSSLHIMAQRWWKHESCWHKLKCFLEQKAITNHQLFQGAFCTCSPNPWSLPSQDRWEFASYACFPILDFHT